eukprot:TRINITY_DN71701_c0_g1_i1.p2 TRINITY_DN71701_c0_g1~~TRINITY_DN71701_c0_g1_i1.p2  ORF type:complete len:197 (+),score=12.71 TRINITY_DN71701_c0_g1_i1:111-701(+)
MPLSPMDVAGADLKSKLGRRYASAKDPRYASAPAFSFGTRSKGEINNLASNRPFYCKTGTHRCPQGELLLDKLRRRDDKAIDALRATGRHWKATPGPGTYRIPRALGAVERRDQEVALGPVCMPDRGPAWLLGSQAKRPPVYHTLGGSGHTHDCDCRLRPPTPRNLSPGPGRYFQSCDSVPSIFAHHMGPQGRQVV